MTLYFTGCTHFGHSKIIELAKRPFNDVEEMDAALVRNWNAVVKKRDTVIHLGDFAFRTPEKYLAQLNGKIIQITGNHDEKRKVKGEIYMEIKARQLPNIVSGSRLPEEIPGLVLFHYPIDDWNGKFHGALHIHCHTHDSALVSAPGRFNVGVEACDYRPISLEEILAHENAWALKAAA